MLPPFVQDLLDRGHDPLADERSQQWLLAHPEALEAFAATRRVLGDLRTLPPIARPWRRAVPWVGVIAAAAIAAAVLRGRSDANAAPRPLPRPDFAAMTLVSCRVSTSEIGGGSARERVLTGNVLQTAEHYVSAPTATARHIAARVVEQRVLEP